MGKDEREVFHPPPPTQGGDVGHQREVPNGVHALHGGAVLEGHRPLTQWTVGFHWVDKTGKLLSWIGG